MNPWHDVYVDDHLVENEFPVVIEVPQGSKNKYELDKSSGLLRLDRVLYSAVHYPANYGFIPRTYCDDGDPLDVLVLGQEPVVPLAIVEARAIAVIRMRDEKGIDDKIIAVSTEDPSVNEYTSYTELPKHIAARDGPLLPGLQGAREQGSHRRRSARTRRGAGHHHGSAGSLPPPAARGLWARAAWPSGAPRR